MTALLVLIVIAIFQGAFLLMLVVFIGVRRQVERQRRQGFLSARQAISEPLSAWLSGSGEIESVVVALRALPAAAVVGFALHLARTTLPLDARDALAASLRQEPWVRRTISGASSRFWTRRLDAARCLALAGTPDDSALLETLLNDPVPGVAVAAADALPRVADARLVAVVLDRMVSLPTVMRLYLQGILRELRTIVEPLLLARLSTRAAPRALAHWVELAGALELPAVFDVVAQLAVHQSVQVRVAVARALRRSPRQQSVDVLKMMLHDADPTVRATTAHALGELASPTVLPDLLGAARDVDWRVRYRATLALSQLGEAGRTALRTLRTDSDRYVADMAMLISGLSDGALLEMVEA